MVAEHVVRRNALADGEFFMDSTSLYDAVPLSPLMMILGAAPAK